MNIEAAPTFVDAANGNFRLLDGSPCIYLGENKYVDGAVDLDEKKRIVNSRIDLGAYEFQQ
jgi:hypothetical protein